MGVNEFSAYRTSRPGITRIEAQLSDYVYPVHSHAHFCVGWVQDGALNSRYGLRRYTVARGDIILVNPGEAHDGRPSGRSGRCYTMLEIDPEIYRQVCFDATGKDWLEFPQPIVHNPKVRRALCNWLGALSGANALAEREAATILLACVLAGGEPARGRRIARELALRAGARMREEPDHADSIVAVATEMGASRYQIIRAFKQTYGMTPEDFRRQLRLERARSGLSTDRTLAEIAAWAGFSDQSHMTREFKRLTGLTPSEYRLCLR